MQLPSAHFPAGRSGAGLLLLRLSAAIAILLTPEVATDSPWPWVGPVLAAMVILGLWTRLAAALCLALLALGMVHGADVGFTGAQVLGVAAIVLLGAGAYAADAVIFGRRTMKLKR